MSLHKSAVKTVETIGGYAIHVVFIIMYHWRLRRWRNQETFHIRRFITTNGKASGMARVANIYIYIPQ